MKRTLAAVLLLATSALASDLSLTTGLAVTPNRQAFEGRLWNQESRLGPTAGMTYRKWFGRHQGVFAEGDYVNTDTRLQNYSLNTWTMHRISFDGGYAIRITRGRFSPYLKAGAGAMMFVSAMDTTNTSAGLDVRMDGLAGAGVSYRFSRRCSALLEYEGRLIRNPNFADKGWFPQRNWLSEPKLGLTYTFRHAERE